MHTVTRGNWRETVRDRHLSAAILARATGKSQRAVRSYLEGQRNPSDEWIANVARLVAAMDSASVPEVVA